MAVRDIIKVCTKDTRSIILQFGLRRFFFAKFFARKLQKLGLKLGNFSLLSINIFAIPLHTSNIH